MGGGKLENSMYFCLLKNSHLGGFGSLVRCKNRVKMGHNSLGRWVGVEDALMNKVNAKKLRCELLILEIFGTILVPLGPKLVIL